MVTIVPISNGTIKEHLQLLVKDYLNAQSNVFDAFVLLIIMPTGSMYDIAVIDGTSWLQWAAEYIGMV